MFGIDEPEKQKALVFGLLVVGGAVLFYMYLWSPLHAERTLAEEHLAGLDRANQAARAVTQPRRVQELRQREAEYQVALAAYETMLPSEAEVPTLLEEIAGAALVQEVEIVAFTPQPAIRGTDLVEFPYDLQIQGGYHDVGRFVAEVVNLPRLVRPAVVSLAAVEIEPATETLPAEYEVLATLMLSTFVPAGEIGVAEAGSTADGAAGARPVSPRRTADRLPEAADVS